MSLEPSSLGFFDGVLTRPVFYVKQDFLNAMLGALASDDRDFARYYNPSFVFSPVGYDLGFKLPMAEVYGNPELCALLADHTRAVRAPPLDSVERIDEQERAELPATPPPPIAVLRRCASCHEDQSSGFAGVEIPFSDPVGLRRKLRFEPSLTSGTALLKEMLARISPGSRDRMPPEFSGPPLTVREHRELAAYVSALAVEPR